MSHTYVLQERVHVQADRSRHNVATEAIVYLLCEGLMLCGSGEETVYEACEWCVKQSWSSSEVTQKAAVAFSLQRYSGVL